MPIFEYKCKNCGTDFEALVLNTNVSAQCKKCGSEKIEKQLSVFSTSMIPNSTEPCSYGSCPSDGMAGTGCSGGRCPFP